jgi:predicted secreted Zn-dependent protease
MSKKHFKALADMIAHNVKYRVGSDPAIARIRLEVIKRMAEDIADICEAQNVRFNRSRFMNACGLDYCKE